MRVEVLLNERAGSAPAGPDRPGPEDVRAALKAASVDGVIRCVPGSELQQTALAACDRGVDAVVAGGGDGTVSAVAGALAGRDTPLGVLPLGTLNHFAKDNQIPLDLPSAVATIAAGHSAALDVACVNDRVFVNNSSLGVYARALVNRDLQRDELGLSKWPAMLSAVWRVFRRSPLMRVHLDVDGETSVRRTPLVFVGNNEYRLELLRVGTRGCLNCGVLSLYIANTASRWGMLKLGVRAALGRLEQARDFETRCVDKLRIDTRRSRIHVAVDGEVIAMTTPLEYRVWPGALRVLTPAAAAQAVATNGSANDAASGEASDEPEAA